MEFCNHRNIICHYEGYCTQSFVNKPVLLDRDPFCPMNERCCSFGPYLAVHPSVAHLVSVLKYPHLSSVFWFLHINLYLYLSLSLTLRHLIPQLYWYGTPMSVTGTNRAGCVVALRRSPFLQFHRRPINLVAFFFFFCSREPVFSSSSESRCSNIWQSE